MNSGFSVTEAQEVRDASNGGVGIQKPRAVQLGTRPFYQDDYATIFHADSRDILPSISADLVLTDPPYGVNKAEWDNELPLDVLHVAATRAKTLAVMPGISNLASMPRFFGALPYRWTLSVRISNGMTRSPVGFGNWIACLVYSSGSIFGQDQDAAEISIKGDKVPHPSPKATRGYAVAFESLARGCNPRPIRRIWNHTFGSKAPR